MLYKLSNFSFPSFTVTLFHRHLFVLMTLSPFLRLSHLRENILNSYTQYSSSCCSVRFILFLSWTKRQLLYVSNQDKQNTYNFTNSNHIWASRCLWVIANVL